MVEERAGAELGIGKWTVEEIAQLLAPLPIFARLDPSTLAAVAGHCGFAYFHAGDTIMEEGRVSTIADVILSGEVDVFVDTPAGRVHVATVGPPHLVGELGALAAMPRSATVIARSDLCVLRIERDNLMSLTAEHPSIGVAIIAELGQRLHGMNRSLAYLTYAATALGRDEYDPDMLAELTRQPGELANFARAFANMAAELEAASAAATKCRLPRRSRTRSCRGRSGVTVRLLRSISMPRCTRRARSAVISTTIF